MRDRLFKKSFVQAFGLAIGVLLSVTVPAAAQSEMPVDTYQADGTTYFLLQLQGPEAETGPVDLAVLVDVSAAQMGKEVRDQAYAAVESLLAGLPEGSRVNLFTAETETNSLTGGFETPDSTVMADSLAALKKNTPLGAIDLAGALKTAAGSFDAASSNRHGIVFIGRGVSTGTFFDKNALSENVRAMVDQKTTFSAYSNGAITDNNVLGILANQTGGYLVDPNLSDGAQAGQLLAKAQKAAVLWPEADAEALPAGVSLYPAPMPPVRSDQPIFLVGKTDDAEQDVTCTVKGTTASGEGMELPMSLLFMPSDDENAWFSQAEKEAETDDGLTLPFAGPMLLKEYQAALTLQNNEGVKMAELALEEGRPDEALQIADAVADKAPQTKGLQDVLAQAAMQNELFAKAEQELDQPKVEREATLLDASDANRKLESSKLKTEVKVAIEEATRLAKTDPEVAIQRVKLQISAIEANPYLTDNDRQELLNSLRSNAKVLDRQKFETEKRRLAAMRNKAILDSVTSVMNQQVENQRKVEEIMKRFHSLVTEGQYVLAADVALKAENLLEDVTLPTQAALVANRTATWNENQYLRYYRRDRFLDVLMSVERSHVPMSDEPPILYPDAETWLALSKARKEKYADTSLFTQTEMQKRIVKALDKIIDVKVQEEDGLPLQDWFTKLQTDLDINIVIDTKALEEDPEIGSVDSCTIDSSLYGMTLRSALGIALRKYNLQYCVCDEYLWITTKDALDSLEPSDDMWRQMYSLRFYPVSDLTLQPSSGTASMGGGMGGGMGGMGGGMMGGMGGSGMGGGMGGGGMGGGWNVPASADKHPEEASAPKTPQTVAPQSAGTLSAAAADIDEKWDNWLAANAPAQPVPAQEGTDEEREAKNKAAEEEYAKALYDFGMKFMTEVYQMTVDKNYEEAAAAIKSAIRADLAAGWMYEALTLVQIQMGAPQPEIEKTILSALEFTSDPVSILGIAGYLETVGSDAKALELYREISKKAPERPEPYVRGLALAKDLNDEEAQKWVALGIASGAWEGDLVADVWQPGLDMAKSLTEKMIAEGRDAEAAEFEQKLSEALVRDMRIELFWTGDAEIDVAVQEPGKTVCWFAQPRTASGGILQTMTQYDQSFDEQKEGIRTKTYICPVAFNGEYNVLVSKTWGDLPQNKVTVEITTYIGTEFEKKAVYPLELTDGKSLFTVNMEHGRRTEAVKQEMLTAAALVDQMKIQNDKEMAEKVRQYQDRKAKADAHRIGATQNYVSSYRDKGESESVKEGQSEFAAPEVKYTLDPNSGYMPVINTLSVGAQFQPQLGITPDRRYLLINPNQSFTGLVRMFTYNTYGGTSGSSSGMGGGGSTGMGRGGGGMGGGGMGGGMGGGGMGGGRGGF